MLASSFLKLMKAILDFMKTRPSIITQMDFDLLSQRRLKEKNQHKKNFYNYSKGDVGQDQNLVQGKLGRNEVAREVTVGVEGEGGRGNRAGD